MRDIKVRAGAVLRIAVAYEGWPKPEFVWKRDDEVIEARGRISASALAGKCHCYCYLRKMLF